MSPLKARERPDGDFETLQQYIGHFDGDGRLVQRAHANEALQRLRERLASREAERDELRADNERLRAALENVPESPEGPWLSLDQQRMMLDRWFEKEYRPWRSGQRLAALSGGERKGEG